MTAAEVEERGRSDPPQAQTSPEQAESNADAKAAPALAGMGDLGQVAINETKKTFKAAAGLVIQTQGAVGKVKLENKIGRQASGLDDTDPLKVISLSSQRAIRTFGLQEAAGVSTSYLDEEHELSPAGPHHTVLHSPAEDTSASRYGVRQPAFKCHQLFNDAFRRIRSAFGISERQFYAVLGLQDKRVESSFFVIGSGDASGKSPSFFFLSADQRFILKSCTRRDTATLTKILSGYRNHVELCKTDDNDNSSLLPRYIGLYQFEFTDPNVPDCTLVVMTNFFAGAYRIDKKFDLKGSTYHRTASGKERTKKSPVFKDLDWIGEGRKLTFPTKEEVADIWGRLEKDTLFLRHNNLIDYSLLVGIHEIGSNGPSDGKDDELDGNSGGDRRSEAMHVVCSTSPTEKRYFGIVDILTPYVLKKKAETLFTGTLACRGGISCQPPSKYQERFMAFCDEEILAVE